MESVIHSQVLIVGSGLAAYSVASIETGPGCLFAVLDSIRTVRLGEKPICLVGDRGNYTCDVLVIACDAASGYAGSDFNAACDVPALSECRGGDGFLNRGLNVLVVGNGSMALELALLLSKIASNVTLMSRRSRLSRGPIQIEGLIAKVAKDRIGLALNQVSDVVGCNSAKINSVGMPSTSCLECGAIAAVGVFNTPGHLMNAVLVDPLRAKGEHCIVTLDARQGLVARINLVAPHDFRKCTTA